MNQFQSDSSSSAPNTAEVVAHSEYMEKVNAITAQCQTVDLRLLLSFLLKKKKKQKKTLKASLWCTKTGIYWVNCFKFLGLCSSQGCLSSSNLQLSACPRVLNQGERTHFLKLQSHHKRWLLQDYGKGRRWQAAQVEGVNPLQCSVSTKTSREGNTREKMQILLFEIKFLHSNLIQNKAHPKHIPYVPLRHIHQLP